MIEIDQVVRHSDEFPEWSSLHGRDSDQRRYFRNGIRAMAVFLYLCHEQIGYNCHPEVRPHCIFRVAPQGLYDYVLFDPFVEYLNIPPMSIQASHLCCTDFEVVRDERNFFPTVIDADHTHRLWVEVYRFGGKAYGKVTLDTFFPVGIRQLSMANDFILHVLLWPAYPVGSCQMEAEKCIEVNISLVHHVEGVLLRFDDVQFIAVMPSAVCDVDVSGNTPTEVQQRMHLHASLTVFPQSPCSQFDAGGYGSGILCIQDIVYRNLRYLCPCVKRPDYANEVHSKFLIYAVVAVLVGTRQARMLNCLAKAKVIKAVFMRLKAQADVTQGIAVGKLTKEQMEQLVIARQFLCVPVTMIFGNQFVELIPWYVIHYLGENIATDVHNNAVLGCKVTQSISNQKIKERSETLINKGIFRI